ncbi:MAG: EAL domain-containing protein [Bermanella sp.]
MTRFNEKPKVLVVDDLKENLVAMRHVLKKIDGDIVCVESGNEALKELIRNEYSVVLLDVQMPEMNGFETAELIRCNEKTQSLPIIFLTAISKDDQYVRQGYELGAVDYLFKPFDPDILRYKVSVFMELDRQKDCLLNLANKNQLILDSVSEGVLGVDVQGKIIFSNPAASSFLALDKERLKGLEFSNFILDYNKKDWEDGDLYKACIQENDCAKKNLRFCNRLNKQFPVECTITAMRDSNKALEGFVLVFDDISAKLKAEEQLVDMAERDSLTGLANRRMFYRLLPSAIAKAKRFNHQVALLFIDIDRFKEVNDSLGHMAGDMLLTLFSKRLDAATRETDTVVRLSGDEFTVILEGDLDKKKLSKLLSKLVSILSEPYEINEKKIKCTVSIGAAIFSEVPGGVNDFIRAADVAMYNAKESGRNNFQFYDKNLKQKTTMRTKIESNLKLALENGEFYLNYQPKIDFLSEKIVGVESLVRWNSKVLGHISPDNFIPIAEDNGLINDIGIWVLKKSCEQFKAWQAQGVIENEFCISVNLSTKQLNDANFLLKLDNILKKTGIDPKNLDVEITETTLMSDPEAAIPLLRILSQMGITISIDDFGTGYSSLNYLKILPINFLKIDQSFVRDLFTDNNSNIITCAIINLAHNLGLGVVAEGVETKAQVDFLKEYKCDIAQGYFYSKPVLASEIKSIGAVYPQR